MKMQNSFDVGIYARLSRDDNNGNWKVCYAASFVFAKSSPRFPTNL